MLLRGIEAISKQSKFLSFLIFLTFLFFISPAGAENIHVIKIDDNTINPITAAYITDAIDNAYQDNAECLILELDTPGGLLSSTRSIVKKILQAKIPVIVYIYPGGSRAGSAGVFITYASHIAAMAPSTNIGAAHPVAMGRGDKGKSIKDAIKGLKKEEKKENTEEPKDEEPEETDIMSGKILNDTVAFIKALAKERNRNIEWAEKSVTESASITEQEALKMNVIEIIAKDEKDLLNQIHGREVKIGGVIKKLNTKNASLEYIGMDVRQRFLDILANPNIAYILLILGFYGLLYEITHPGIGFPGIAGAIFIILAFFSMQTLPTNYAGLALIILGIILFIAEVKVPGFGILTLGGLVCMVLGSLLLFDSPDKIMRVSINLIISLSLATAGITIVLVRAVVVSYKRKVVSGKEGLISEIGRAQTEILPDRDGKVFVHGEIWDAVSKEEIKEGEKIEAVKVDGMVLEVKKQ